MARSRILTRPRSEIVAPAANPQNEQDTRLGILNTLLTTPHRRLEQVYPLHQQMIQQDPLFYVRLAAWYSDTGEIRDHKETFIVNLCLSSFEGHRDVGLALLRELPPHQVCRIIDFIHGKWISEELAAPRQKKSKKEIMELVKKAKADKAAGIKPPKEKPKKVLWGLNRNLPDSIRTEVGRYLHEREADDQWFDSNAVIAREAMRRLYSLTQTKPSQRANAILFENKPPEGSTAHTIKQLANAKTPADQAKVIMDLKIPYRIACSVVTAMTPTVLLALIEVMSPQELISNLGNLKRRGVLDNPELKEVVNAKLELAKKSKKVSALKTKEAIKAADLDEETVTKLEEVADSSIKGKGQIKKDTAIFIDKSGSQQASIATGKQLAAMISTIVAPGFNLYVYAFDSMPYAIVPTTNKKVPSMADWEKAMAGINATGGTRIDAPLQMMIRGKERVDQIVIVSDGGDGSNLFADAYRRYAETVGCKPTIGLVHVPGDSDWFSDHCKKSGIEISRWDITGQSDYFSIPGLIPFLTSGSKLDLLMDIMAYPLPKRKAA